MFGRQARLPVDIMYGTSTQQSSSPGEHARLLQYRLQSAFQLLREHTAKEHQRQKEFYDLKLHGEPYKVGDYVWLHLPPPKGVSRKLYHPWTGPYKVIKKLSEVTYRIQHLQGRHQRKVVHFDRLKPCSRATAQTCSQSSFNKPPETVQPHINSPPAWGNNLELIDKDIDNNIAGQDQPLPRRYPTRVQHPPCRFDDFVAINQTGRLL